MDDVNSKVRKLIDKIIRTIFFDPWLLGNWPWQPHFWPIFGGFEGFTRLECGISWPWVQNEYELKTKVIPKSSSRLTSATAKPFR